MITENTFYRVGSRALAFMIVKRLKYALYLAIIMIAITVLMSYQHATLAAWDMSGSFLHTAARTLYAIERYGWVLTFLLSLTFAAVATFEYLGRQFGLGDTALYVRTGILTHRQIAIPYRQVQTINLIEKPLPRLFGLVGMLVVTSASAALVDDEATLPLIQKDLAEELQAELLRRADTAARG